MAIPHRDALAQAIEELVEVFAERRERRAARREVDDAIDKSAEAARKRSDAAGYEREPGDRRLRAALMVEQAAYDELDALDHLGAERSFAAKRLKAAQRALVEARERQLPVNDRTQPIRTRTDDDERSLVRTLYKAGLPTRDVKFIVNHVRARVDELAGVEPRSPICSQHLCKWRREDENAKHRDDGTLNWGSRVNIGVESVVPSPYTHCRGIARCAVESHDGRHAGEDHDE